MCRQNPDNQYSDKTEVKHIDMKEESLDYSRLSLDYTPEFAPRGVKHSE